MIPMVIGDGDGSYKQATGRGSSHPAQDAHHFSCWPARKTRTHTPAQTVFIYVI